MLKNEVRCKTQIVLFNIKPSYLCKPPSYVLHSNSTARKRAWRAPRSSVQRSNERLESTRRMLQKYSWYIMYNYIIFSLKIKVSYYVLSIYILEIYENDILQRMLHECSQYIMYDYSIFGRCEQNIQMISCQGYIYTECSA